MTEGDVASAPAWLRRVHLFAGLLGLGAFLVTGQYMDGALDHLRGMPDAARALYRSGHIYILFAALLHLALGLYLSPLREGESRKLQYLGSAVLVAALGLLLYGFAVETPRGIIERHFTRTGIQLSLAGVLVHGLAAFISSLGEPGR